MNGKQNGGRRRNITGQGKGLGRRGSGLGTGPVGRKEGYSGRPSSIGGGSGSSSGGSSGGASGGGISRAAFGKGGLSLILVIVIAFFAIRGCLPGGSGSTGGGIDFMSSIASMLGGSSDSILTGGDALSGLSSIFGGMGGSASTTSSKWDSTANVGKLDTTVASGARAKRTTILGGGRDVVTVMIYMCGTDLESKHGMATNDLTEMTKATIGSNVNLIVMTGGCSKWKNDIVSSSVNQVYRVESGGVKCIEKDFGSDAMVKPATLTKFVKYCRDNYPANRYDLIFWDHGGGSVTGYGYDEKNKSAGAMNLKGINEALGNSGVTFDFIGFDACLMATLETGLMLDSYADYMIASEETEPGVGWYYTDWLTALSNNTSMPTTEIGKNIIDSFISFCDQKCPGQKTTLSLVDLAELSATVPDKLNDFALSTTDILKGDDYKKVSDARAVTREFAPSNRIDQVDLVHLANNVGTDEGKQLSAAILGAVKYNKTSSAISNAYGLSIYFPYRKTSTVDSAVATYKAIGIDDSYSRCIKQFASLEVSGQAVSSAGSGSAFPIGGSLGSILSGGGVTDILGSLLGGGRSLSDLTGGNSEFFGSDINVEDSAEYITETQFDASKLVWTKHNDGYLLDLDKDQWELVHDIRLNVFYDDGEGYIDLGLDNVYYVWAETGSLIGAYDGAWLAINEQPVAFYCIDSTESADRRVTTGRVPVLLNGEKADLVIVFDDSITGDEEYDAGHSSAYVAGVLRDYTDVEEESERPDVVAKVAELQKGDVIDFICDYYEYDGTYRDTYKFGDRIVYDGELAVSDVYLPEPEKASAAYMFTDIYCNEFWTPIIPYVDYGE